MICAVIDTNVIVSALLTKNPRHFPSDPLVVTPAEFAALLETA